LEVTEFKKKASEKAKTLGWGTWGKGRGVTSKLWARAIERRRSSPNPHPGQKRAPKDGGTGVEIWGQVAQSSNAEKEKVSREGSKDQRGQRPTECGAMGRNGTKVTASGFLK